MRGVLFDLLMAVMDSLSVWTEAAGGGGRGIEGAPAAGLRSTLGVRRPDHHADDATIIVVASLHVAVSAIDPR